MVSFTKETVHETHEQDEVPLKFLRLFFEDDEGQQLILKLLDNVVVNYILIGLDGK